MIYLTRKVFLKLKYYVKAAEGEISGLGRSKVQNGSILITDVLLFKQKSSYGSTTLDEAEMAKFLYEKTKNGEDMSSYNVWWHSHGSMGVFWSTTDEKTVGTTSGSDYMISIVMNKKLEVLSRLDFFKPIWCVCNLEVKKPLFAIDDYDLKKKCLAEVKEKVSEKVYYYNAPYFKKNKKKRKFDKMSFEEQFKIKFPDEDPNEIQTLTKKQDLLLGDALSDIGFVLTENTETKEWKKV